MHTLDLVVAAAPTFDLLLGVYFLDSSGATIHMKKRQALLTGMLEVALITQPVPIYVGKGPGAPIRTVLCVEHDDAANVVPRLPRRKLKEKPTEEIMEETAEKAMDITPAEPKAASLVTRLRELADQLDSSHQAGDVLQTELSQSAEQLMKLAETQKEGNQEAEEAQEFIDALHQVSGRTNKGPAKPVTLPEAGVDPFPGRLQHLWDEQ